MAKVDRESIKSVKEIFAAELKIVNQKIDYTNVATLKEIANVSEKLIHIIGVLEEGTKDRPGIIDRVEKLENDREVNRRATTMLIGIISATSSFAGSIFIPFIISWLKEHIRL